MERDTSALFTNTLRLLWRRQWVVYLCLLLTSSAAVQYHERVGERYEAYSLLRVGQGIKERSGNPSLPFGEGIDLQSRMESLARMAKIDFVIHEAASRVGYDRLSVKAEKTRVSSYLDAYLTPMKAWLEEAVSALGSIDSADASAKEPPPPRTDVQAAIDHHHRAILKLRDDVVAKQEGRSDLLRVSFRHSDPSVAARYLDELANALVAVHNTDVQLPGAQEFFQQQSKRLGQEAQLAAANLQNFSVKASIYAVDEQRQLLLRRVNELASSISTTRGVIEDRKGQKQSIAQQLQVLRPVTQSKTVTRVVKALGGLDPRSSGTAPEELEETPPLLLVRVYQDNMAALMKVNAELNGATQLLDQLGKELDDVNQQLALLSAQEAEYARLKQAFTTASTAAAHYASRMVDEQINSEVAKKTQLSSLRVVQRAIPPTAPVFPQVQHLVGLALLAGILLGIAMIVVPDIVSCTRTATAIQVARHDERENLLSLFVAGQRREASKDHRSA